MKIAPTHYCSLDITANNSLRVGEVISDVGLFFNGFLTKI